MEHIPKEAKAIGYQWLIDHFKLTVIPYYRSSYLIDHGSIKVLKDRHPIIYLYTSDYALDNPDNPLKHLIFALNHEGLNLEIISGIFAKIPADTIQNYVNKQPTGKYERIVWYLYENLTGTKLSIPDVKFDHYIDLLNTEEYYTCTPIPEKRYGINNNLLGDMRFCPFVRKTDSLKTIELKNLDHIARNIIKPYDHDIVVQTSNSLHKQETLASYDIGNNRPNKRRIDDTIEFSKNCKPEAVLTGEILIRLQNNLVDKEFINTTYRKSQNYIGQSIDHKNQIIGYISPKPDVVDELMAGLLNSTERMISSNIHPIIIATTLSFGLLFIHPFRDGNGRLHRFLIHYILMRTKFTSQEIILPISGIMFANMQQYNAILAHFSKLVINAITDYDLSEEGVLTVNQDTTSFYRYIDYTVETEYIAQCIDIIVTKNLKNELEFQKNYTVTKQKLSEIAEMPDQLYDLFILLVIQNKGKLAQAKRKAQFKKLSDDEIKRMELVVQTTMLANGS